MSDDYLTMARIMEKELQNWIKHEGNRWHAMTGMEQLTAKTAFTSGFMKGFEGKFFSSDN